MKLAPGKIKGLEAVSNSRGVIAAAAMDQRGSLQSAIAKEKGIDRVIVRSRSSECSKRWLNSPLRERRRELQEGIMNNPWLEWGIASAYR